MDEKEKLVQENTELRRRLAELEASERKYREIVQNANSIILRMDTQGNITFLNEFAQRFFGYYENEVLGKNIVGLIVAETDDAGVNLKAVIQDIVSSPERHSNNVNENVRSNGEKAWIAWTNKAITGPDGRVVEILSIGNDISKVKQHIDALHSAQAKVNSQKEGR